MRLLGVFLYYGGLRSSDIKKFSNVSYVPGREEWYQEGRQAGKSVPRRYERNVSREIKEEQRNQGVSKYLQELRDE